MIALVRFLDAHFSFTLRHDSYAHPAQQKRSSDNIKPHQSMVSNRFHGSGF
jgi:hypothetical protein